MDESAGHVAPGSYHESGSLAAWNERYSTQGMVWGADANQFVAEFAENLQPGRVLDLGCGQGRNAVWLAQRGHKVTAIDFSDQAIATARALASQTGAEVSFLVADLVTEWHPTPSAFDLVLLSYLQLPARARRAVHAKVVRTLAPGGKVFLIAHHADNLAQGVGGPPYPEVLFREDDLAGDFANLDILSNQKVFRPVQVTDEVTCHAHDLRLLAQKPA